MGYPALFARYGGQPPARAGVRHATVVPYGVYRCANGEGVNLAVQTEGQWARFCRDVCGHPEWEADPRFATSADRRRNRDPLETAIEEVFSELPRVEITRRLEAADIPWGDVREVDAFLAHPQLAARGRWREVATPAGPIEAIVPPFDLEGMDHRMDPVPDVGQHTDDVLRELDYGPEEIERLRARHVV
jgi:formyl-CoA transferase